MPYDLPIVLVQTGQFGSRLRQTPDEYAVAGDQWLHRRERQPVRFALFASQTLRPDLLSGRECIGIDLKSIADVDLLIVYGD